jgi:chromosomal replication initiation ATPase DnaA
VAWFGCSALENRTLYVPNLLAKNWIENHYAAKMDDIFENVEIVEVNNG